MRLAPEGSGCHRGPKAMTIFNSMSDDPTTDIALTRMADKAIRLGAVGPYCNKNLLRQGLTDYEPRKMSWETTRTVVTPVTPRVPNDLGIIRLGSGDP